MCHPQAQRDAAPFPLNNKSKQNNPIAAKDPRKTHALIINSFQPQESSGGFSTEVFNLAVNINNNAQAMHTSL